MTVTLVHVQVIKEHIPAFIKASEENHVHSVKELGNLRFDIIQKEDDPGTFVLYEAYTTEAAAAAHKKTAHYLLWREIVAPMMASPREGIKYLGLKIPN